MSWIFSSCVGLSSIDLSPLDTNNVTDTSFMFYGCTGLKTLDLTPMNTRACLKIKNCTKHLFLSPFYSIIKKKGCSLC